MQNIFQTVCCQYSNLYAAILTKKGKLDGGLLYHYNFMSSSNMKAKENT